MKHLKLVTALILSLGLAAGCSSPTDETPDNGETDGGTQTGTDAGKTDNENKDPKKLYIEVTSALTLTNLALKDKEAVNGLISVKKDGDNVPGATLKLNDTEIPESADTGTYDVGTASLTSVTPGAKATFIATFGGETATLELDCPAEVTITTPAEGATVTAGDSIAFAWTGTIAYENFSKPSASIVTYNSTNGKLGLASPTNSARIDGSSATVTVPSLDGTDDGWLAQLSVPGNSVETVEGFATCTYVRRNQLKP